MSKLYGTQRISYIPGKVLYKVSQMVFYKVCIGYRRGIMYFMRCSTGNSIGHPTGYSIWYSIWYINGIIEGILSGLAWAVGYSIRCIHIYTHIRYTGGIL